MSVSGAWGPTAPSPETDGNNNDKEHEQEDEQHQNTNPNENAFDNSDDQYQEQKHINKLKRPHKLNKKQHRRLQTIIAGSIRPPHRLIHTGHCKDDKCHHCKDDLKGDTEHLFGSARSSKRSESLI